MKTAIAIFVTLALTAVTGCIFGGTKESPQGGVTPKDEGFSITVPASNTIKQGASETVTVSLNRGAYFKRDVQLDITSGGLSVTPANILVKASDKPDVKFQIMVAKNAALGEYSIAVKGTPETGRSTSAEFTVKVASE